MSNLDVSQAIKLATDTYPDILDNPVTKAGFIYANEMEQAVFVIEKLLIKLKCHSQTNTTYPIPESKADTNVVSMRKHFLEMENRISAIASDLNDSQEAVIKAQAALIEAQNKRIEKQKELIKVYQESSDKWYDLLKEYMPEEEYESLITGVDP